jgi:hypothetical protein
MQLESGNRILLHYLIRVRFGYNFEKSFNNSLPLSKKRQPRGEMTAINTIKVTSLLTPDIIIARNTASSQKTLFLVVFFLE